MSKAKAAARKKTRLAKKHAAMALPPSKNDDANAPAAEETVAQQHAPKFDPKSNQGGGMRQTGGRGPGMTTALTRGAARSK
jgi:hypothetical protein